MALTEQAPLAVSIGDPSGIGPDVLLKAWADKSLTTLPPFFVIADISFLEARSDQLGLAIAFEPYVPGEIDKLDGSKLPVFSLEQQLEGNPGKPSLRDAAGTIRSIEIAVSMCFAGDASGVVTCPINKKVLYEAGFNHPGHTEFLAQLAAEKTGEECLPVMMLAGPLLKTVPVTIHIPLADVPGQLTTDQIVRTGEIVAHDLKALFGIANPRLALSGLNPHAGEEGAMGAEDMEIIQPAVEALRSAGISVLGPLPADTMFHASARETYDVAICMYHDQALIPAKTLGFDDAVNVTLGLPFIRTSPDHGTAHDIAGTGKANPSSFVAALRMAHQMAANS